MINNDKKFKVLFLCTGNSCRSQMAEGWAKHLLSDVVDAYSAGTQTHGMNPRAVQAMADNGIDIASNCSKRVSDLEAVNFDYVFTVCDNARQNCPTFPGNAVIIHNAFDDPPFLAKNAANDDEAMVHYQRVCGEIRDWVAELPAMLA